MDKAGIVRLRRMGLDQPALRHRHHLGAGDDEVIEQPHVDERQGLLDSLRQMTIRLAGFGLAGWMGQAQSAAALCFRASLRISRG